MSELSPETKALLEKAFPDMRDRLLLIGAGPERLERLVSAAYDAGAANHKRRADSWRGIAAAMGYEPKAHLDVRPTSEWLLDRVAKYRAAVVAEALASPVPAAQEEG